MAPRKTKPPTEDSKAQALSATRRLRLAREAYRKKLGIATTGWELWPDPWPPANSPRSPNRNNSGAHSSAR